MPSMIQFCFRQIETTEAAEPDTTGQKLLKLSQSIYSNSKYSFCFSLIDQY